MKWNTSYIAPPDSSRANPIIMDLTSGREGFAYTNLSAIFAEVERFCSEHRIRVSLELPAQDLREDDYSIWKMRMWGSGDEGEYFDDIPFTHDMKKASIGDLLMLACLMMYDKIQYTNELKMQWEGDRGKVRDEK